MEAATTQQPIAGDKAKRIVDAMRSSVARRGAAGSTFDHVAREAGVSRGLLHYYFGTKERLLVEVVRRDCDIRMDILDAALSDVRTAEDFVDALVRSLEDVLENDPDFYALLFEITTMARRNDEIAGELSDLYRRTRRHVADLLQAKQDEGVLRLADEPEAVAAILFALGDGIALQVLHAPDRVRELGKWVRAGVVCARALLGA
ncbi:MAG TPA: TetR/AcrR family transcriptional regulator [Solirubrobacteraceae bacterium]|jgi:AcrR family transcriptional regulator|nr:TetR/AcrR family transcriptional regulator [Solirubrobacteraceae bacterium]